MVERVKNGFVYVILATVVLYLGSVAITIVPLLRRFGIGNAILPEDLLTVYESYSMRIDVPSWYFFILLPITVWQLLALAYCLSTLCRQDLGTGGKLYYAPPYMPITMYAMYGTGAISQVAWVFSWSYRYISFALGFQAMADFTVFMALHFSTKGLIEHCSDLAQSGQQREIRMVRGLVQNGFAMLVGYMDLVTTLMFGKVLVHAAGLDQDLVTIIIFSIFMASAAFFFIIEMTAWEENGRYILTHHIVPVFSMATIVGNNLGNGPLGTPHYVILATLVVVTLAFLGKVINAWVRGSRADKRLMVGGTSVRVKY